MWTTEDQWRAPPPGDFPPEWASAWGDDHFGLWADLTVGNVTQRMRWIEPSGPDGFWMGSTQQERDAIEDEDARAFANKMEQNPRLVLIDEGFWLADTLCTQAFWQAVMGSNPSHFKHKEDALDCPVEQVSWDEVSNSKNGFNALLAKYFGLGSCRVTLPQESEWEYACRAGSRTAYWWGNVFDERSANADATSKKTFDDSDATSQVQRYRANPWGLYDMHGNVWEWCADIWQERPVVEAKSQKSSDSDEINRVVRGGAWYARPLYARAAFRDWWHRAGRSRDLGFRFALRSAAKPRCQSAQMDAKSLVQVINQDRRLLTK